MFNNFNKPNKYILDIFLLNCFWGLLSQRQGLLTKNVESDGGCFESEIPVYPTVLLLVRERNSEKNPRGKAMLGHC